MNIVVAGGAGFIGSNLVGRLLADGNAVTVLDNFSTGRRSNLDDFAGNSLLSVIETDIVDPFDLPAGYDRIYHLASPASPPGYQRFPVETLRVNSEGTLNLLTLAERTGARFLYASTSEAYGDPLEHPQVETYRGNVSPVGPRSMYDEGKRFGEAMTMAHVRSRGVDGRVVRIFNTYGPKSDPADGRLVPNFITQALKGEPLTVYSDGSQTRSLCYVSDLVDGLIRAMEYVSATGEVINLGNPDEHTVLEYARVIARLVGTSGEVRYEPPAVGDDPQRRRPDIRKATRLLGWRPKVPLEEGMARTVVYFREELGTPASHVTVGAAGQ